MTETRTTGATGRGLLAALFIAIAFVVVQSGSGASSGPAVSVDAAPDASNTATTVGAIDACASVPSGATFDVDVVIQSVDALTGMEANLLYDPLVLNVTGVNYDFLLGTASTSLLDVGDTVPDSDGEFSMGAVTFPLSAVSGSGVLVRVTFNAIADGASPLDLEGVKLADALGDPIQPADSSGVYQGPVNSASVSAGGDCSDSDLDGYDDEDEAGTPLCGNGVNEDAHDDSVADDGCPGGPPQAGQYSEEQFNIGTNPLMRCSEGAESTPSPAWPSDFVSGGTLDSTDRLDITDLSSFVAPVRRLGTSPGDSGFNQRWDISPGPELLGEWINIGDLTAIVAGPTGYPPMFGGQRAFNGPTCSD